ncbi:tetratricopeptide repeat protein [Arsukibacterium perlucidum]|uniref:tetratricopeptide repeat protein n=1 Tax=Arsukibacterium perlucidum TaxID=368811 RepID=UPI0003604BB3|nr:tetratricopeptide repeat protein [Arsukibacterium perlucidum]
MFNDVQDALRQIISENSDSRLLPKSKLLLALEQFPYVAELHFLYGSELAESGKVDDAAASFGQALILQPEMHLARFQLAFLHMVNGNVDAVMVLLQPLLSDDENPSYLTFFARGCIAAMIGNTVECKKLIEKGLALNSQNEALNANMKKLVELVLSDERIQQNESMADDSFGSVLFDIYTQQKH